MTTHALREVDGPIVNASGERMIVRGSATFDITLGEMTVPHELIVVAGLTQKCILGADFLRKHHADILLSRGVLQFGRAELPILEWEQEILGIVCHVSVRDTTTIPRGYELVLPAVVSSDIATGMLEPVNNITERYGALIARVLVSPVNRTVPVRIMNPLSTPCTMFEGTKVGTLLPCTVVDIMVASVDMNTQKQKRASELFNLGESNLSPSEMKDAEALLGQFSDVR